MQIIKIANETDFKNPGSVSAACEKLTTVPEHELHFFMVQRDTLNTTNLQTRERITLAQLEYDRRSNERTEDLTKRTTLLSAGLGIAGVAIGTFIGASLAG